MPKDQNTEPFKRRGCFRIKGNVAYASDAVTWIEGIETVVPPSAPPVGVGTATFDVESIPDDAEVCLALAYWLIVHRIKPAKS